MRYRLSAPRRELFLISVVLAALVVIGQVVHLPVFSRYPLGLLLISYLILLAGVVLD